jgi:hypothetical protein
VTRAGFLGLVIPLCGAAFVGLVLLAHSLWPASSPDTLSCEQWFAEPRSSGTYTVEGCLVDLAYTGWTEDPYAYDAYDPPRTAVAPVFLPGADLTQPPKLFIELDDAESIAFVRRLAQDSDDEARQLRTRARYANRLAKVRTFTGTVDPYGDAYAISRRGRHAPDSVVLAAPQDWSGLAAAEGVLGGAIFVFALGIVAPIAFLQRKWKRTERRLRARAEGRPDVETRPQTF